MYFSYFVLSVRGRCFCALHSLIRRWNGNPSGKVQHWNDSRRDPKAAELLDRVIFDELLKILDRNTQSWQEAFAVDGFVVDRAGVYFMTVLDMAIEESGSQQPRPALYEDFRRVACVVGE